MSYDSDPRPRNDSVNFLYGKVDEALQNALSLQDQPELFHEIILQLRKNADETLSFTAPIWPQKKALKLFVQKSMASFPSFFGSCHQDISLLHHLQRYAACYLAYKSGYFENMNYKHQTARPKSRTKQCVSSNEKASQPKAMMFCPVRNLVRDLQLSRHSLRDVSHPCRISLRVSNAFVSREKYTYMPWPVGARPVFDSTLCPVTLELLQPRWNWKRSCRRWHKERSNTVCSTKCTFQEINQIVC